MKASMERRLSNAVLNDWCASVTGRVLSLGSGGDVDKEGRRYRDYFPQASMYVTSDIEGVDGCDLTLDVRHMHLADASFDALFVSGVLEHIDDVSAAVTECYRVLVPGGVLLVGVPFSQPIHRAPLDFWRFTEYGLRWLLRAFSIQDLVPIGADPKVPAAYWARAVKPDDLRVAS
jgi:SAM-dependent methyltransferase